MPIAPSPIVAYDGEEPRRRTRCVITFLPLCRAVAHHIYGWRTGVRYMALRALLRSSASTLEVETHAMEDRLSPRGAADTAGCRGSRTSAATSGPYRHALVLNRPDFHVAWQGIACLPPPTHCWISSAARWFSKLVSPPRPFFGAGDNDPCRVSSSRSPFAASWLLST